MTNTTQRLFDLIHEQGWQARVVPVEHLVELKDAIHGPHARGLFDGEFYQEQLDFFRFGLPEALPDARSLLIIAVPAPRARIVFHWKDDALPVTVPPTYVGYSSRIARVHAAVADFLEPEGHKLAGVALPLKTLAVRSGLAAYGRNNIVYVPGLGSFLQLVGAFLDLPCAEDPWREPRMLERCETCVACLARCPCGAITRERFLLHAERCLTFHNERAADFPHWIDPSWHHCLVGCMRCQEICPENKPVVEWAEDRGAFSDDETELLVAGTALDQLPAATAAKVRSLELNERYEDLCRNLSMLVSQPPDAA